MGLKYEVESLDGLDDSVKELYTEKDGKFVLGIEGLPQPKDEDVSGLKAKVDELLAEKKASDKKARDAEESARKVAEEAARKNGDTEALEKSWQEKFSKREQELMQQLEIRDKKIISSTVDSVAAALASELSVPQSHKVVQRLIKERLAVEQRDGDFVTVVKDADGKPSAYTLDDLKKEFVSDPAFAPLIVGTKATGGGANGSSSGGAAKKGNIAGSKQERIAEFERRLSTATE